MKWILVALVFASSQAYGDFQQDLHKAVEILNRGVSSENKILLPTDPSKYLNYHLPKIPLVENEKDELKLKETVSQLWALSEKPELECNVLVSSTGLPTLTPLLKGSEVINKEIVDQKAWAKGIAYTSMINKMAFCKSTLIESMIYTSLLNTELETLAKLDAKRMTAQEKENFKKLKKRR